MCAVDTHSSRARAVAIFGPWLMTRLSCCEESMTVAICATFADCARAQCHGYPDHGLGMPRARTLRRLPVMAKMSAGQVNRSNAKPASQSDVKAGAPGGVTKNAAKGTQGRKANDKEGNANAEGKGAAKSRQS